MTEIVVFSMSSLPFGLDIGISPRTYLQLELIFDITICKHLGGCLCVITCEPTFVLINNFL